MSAPGMGDEPAPSGGSQGGSLSPSPPSKESSCDELADALFTDTGLMGRVALDPRTALTLQATHSRTSMHQSPRARRERPPDMSLDLAEMAMYVPNLVLRRLELSREGESVRESEGSRRSERTSQATVGHRPLPLPCSESLRGAVLFADVSGFTELTQRLQQSALGPTRGAEELNTILSDYFDALITSFHVHGGDVVSFSGDAMTVLFEASDGGAGDALGNRASSACPTVSVEQATLAAVRCAQETLRAVDGFSLDGYHVDAGLAGTTISLHIGMGVGAFTAILVSGGSYHRCEPRDGFALLGAPMAQLKAAEKRAGAGQCVLSPEVWKLVRGSEGVDARLDPDGFAFLRVWNADTPPPPPPFPPPARPGLPPLALPKAAGPKAVAATPPRPRPLQIRSAAEYEAAALQQQYLQLPKVELTVRQRTLLQLEGQRSVMGALAPFVPEPVQYRLRKAGMNWLADFRLASIVFMRVLTISHDTPQLLEKAQLVFSLTRGALARFGGMLARFNVDDKGTILFAAFGPPPAQHEDDAARAVLFSLDVLRILSEHGHAARVGVTTGHVFAGSVGNAARGEYTFYGTTVNMAARLMTAAQNSDVLIDEATALDAKSEGDLDLVALPPFAVKGRAEPMAAFRPQRRTAVIPPKPRAAVSANTRMNERDRLRNRMARLASLRVGGLVVIE